MAGPNSPKLAVLIDADNTTPAIVSSLLAEIAKYGTATVKRAYGDWTTPRLSGWKDANNAHAIQPMQQFAYTTGKNATDSALIIDAMDLLYTGNLDGFCLVSSDSDFTKLASRLRESGKTVYGFGEPKTPKALVAACDKFVYLDVLRSKKKPQEQQPDEDTATPAPRRQTGAELRDDRVLVDLLREGVDASSDDDGWAYLGTVGSYIAKQAPDFDSRNWGFAKLVDLVSEIGLFDVERPPGQQIRVREKPTAAAAPETAPPATTRRRTTKKAAAPRATAEKATEKTTESASAPADEPTTPTQAPAKKTSRRTTSRKKAAVEAAQTVPADAAPAPVLAPTPDMAPAEPTPTTPDESAAPRTAARKKTVTRNAVKTVKAAARPE